MIWLVVVVMYMGLSDLLDTSKEKISMLESRVDELEQKINDMTHGKKEN